MANRKTKFKIEKIKTILEDVERKIKNEPNGKGRVKFAKEHGIHASTYYSWLSKYGSSQNNPIKAIKTTSTRVKAKRAPQMVTLNVEPQGLAKSSNKIVCLIGDSETICQTIRGLI